MPRCFSSSIQSEVAWRLALRARTAPAIWIGAAKPQQLFGERRLARVGMRDDGERSAALYFFVERSHGRLLSARLAGRRLPGAKPLIIPYLPYSPRPVSPARGR